MQTGVQEINRSMQMLTELTERLSGVISSLEEGVSAFRTEEELPERTVSALPPEKEKLQQHTGEGE